MSHARAQRVHGSNDNFDLCEVWRVFILKESSLLGIFADLGSSTTDRSKRLRRTLSPRAMRVSILEI